MFFVLDGKNGQGGGLFGYGYLDVVVYLFLEQVFKHFEQKGARRWFSMMAFVESVRNFVSVIMKADIFSFQRRFMQEP